MHAAPLKAHKERTMRETRVAVVGAGTAGLVSAVAAARLGLDVTVFERGLDLQSARGGLLLHPNGRHVLEALGLLSLLRPHLRTLERVTLELPSARIGMTDYSQLDVLKYNADGVMRLRVVEALASALEQASGRLRLGCSCVDITVREGEAILHFDGQDAFRCDVVIAGDGPRSAVRNIMGIRGHVRPLGRAYVRGLAPIHTEDPTVREIWGQDGRRMGICPLPGPHTAFFCSVPLGTWQQTVDKNLQAWIDSWGGWEMSCRTSCAPSRIGGRWPTRSSLTSVWRVGGSSRCSWWGMPPIP